MLSHVVSVSLHKTHRGRTLLSGMSCEFEGWVQQLVFLPQPPAVPGQCHLVVCQGRLRWACAAPPSALGAVGRAWGVQRTQALCVCVCVCVLEVENIRKGLENRV